VVDAAQLGAWLLEAFADSERGDTASAAALVERVLTIQPDHPDALHLRALLLWRAGRLLQALDGLDAALRHAPDNPSMHGNRGLVLRDLGRLDDAVASIRRSLERQPGDATVRFNLGLVLAHLNRLDEAQAEFARVLAHAPSTERALQAALALPAVERSAAAMQATRERFEAGLDALMHSAVPVLQVTPQLFAGSVFYLAYHGSDVRPLLEKLACLYERLHPPLRYNAPHLQVPRDPAAPVRLGFLTRFIDDHPVTHCFAALIEALSADPRFDVVLISPQDFARATAAGTYAAYRGRTSLLPGPLAAARASVAAQQLDLLVYLDIGMDETSYFLAFARLARVQIVLGGHPVTTGLPAIDAFFSSALAEPEGADLHYSERLVRLPVAAVAYARPAVPAVFASRAALGLPQDARLYVCPMMLQKIHPDFDAAVAGILHADAQAVVVFFERAQQPWRATLEQRFDLTVPAALRSRIVFLPFIADRAAFLSLLAHAAVVLDPFHFGIGSTATSVFAVGTPVITWPGRFMRGRSGLMYARLLDTPECVAQDADDYVRRAVAVAGDDALRASLRQRILAHAQPLFDRERAACDVAEALLAQLALGPRTS